MIVIIIESNVMVIVGLAAEWIIPPPDVVEVGQRFNVSYRATALDSFYSESTFFPDLE